MSEVHSITVQIRPPKPGFDGQICLGCYTVADGVVTLTDRDGKPVRDANGKQYRRTLTAAEDARAVAGILTKEFRLALLGKTKESERFSRPIIYPKSGIA